MYRAIGSLQRVIVVSKKEIVLIVLLMLGCGKINYLYGNLLLLHINGIRGGCTTNMPTGSSRMKNQKGKFDIVHIIEGGCRTQ
jgi:hypothetical protein